MLIWAALIQTTSAPTGSETQGFSPNPDQTFQFNLDNGQTFVVVVSEVTPDAGCPGYTVTAGAAYAAVAAGPTPTAAATASPPRAQGGSPGPWTQAAPVAIDHYGGFIDSDGTFAYEGGGYSFSAGRQYQRVREV